MLKAGMTNTLHSAGRRRLLKGGLGLALNPLAALHGVATPMKLAADAFAAAPVAAVATLPHYMFRIVNPLQPTRWLRLYPWHLTGEHPGQGVLSDMKRKSLNGIHADESVAEFKGILQLALQELSEKEKNTPANSTNYKYSIREGMPESIADYFRSRIFDLLVVYAQDQDALRELTKQAMADDRHTQQFRTLFGDNIDHKTIRSRIVEHISTMMGLFEAVDKMVPDEDKKSLSAFDSAVFETLDEAAKVALRRNSAHLSYAEKIEASYATPSETLKLMAGMSEQEKVAVLLRATLFIPCTFKFTEDMQHALDRADFSQHRHNLSDHLKGVSLPNFQGTMKSLHQDVSSYFAQRERDKRASSSPSLSSLMNVTSNTVRSAAAGLVSLFKQGVENTIAKDMQPKNIDVPMLGLPHQTPDIIQPHISEPVKQAVPRDKNAPNPL